jgi:hypothetical protein
MNLQAIFDLDCDFAAKSLQQAGQVHAMFAVHHKRKGENASAVMVADFSSPDAKDMSVKAVRLMGVALDAYAITLVTEAWVATITPKTDAAVAALAPSEREDKREVLMVMMSARGATPQFASIREILRATDGGISLGAAEPDYEGMTGRMTQMLLPKPPTASQRAQARAVLEMIGVNPVDWQK